MKLFVKESIDAKLAFKAKIAPKAVRSSSAALKHQEIKPKQKCQHEISQSGIATDWLANRLGSSIVCDPQVIETVHDINDLGRRFWIVGGEDRRLLAWIGFETQGFSVAGCTVRHNRLDSIKHLWLDPSHNPSDNVGHCSVDDWLTLALYNKPYLHVTIDGICESRHYAPVPDNRVHSPGEGDEGTLRVQDHLLYEDRGMTTA